MTTRTFSLVAETQLARFTAKIVRKWVVLSCGLAKKGSTRFFLHRTSTSCYSTRVQQLQGSPFFFFFWNRPRRERMAGRQQRLHSDKWGVIIVELERLEKITAGLVGGCCHRLLSPPQGLGMKKNFKVRARGRLQRPLPSTLLNPRHKYCSPIRKIHSNQNRPTLPHSHFYWGRRIRVSLCDRS